MAYLIGESVYVPKFTGLKFFILLFLSFSYENCNMNYQIEYNNEYLSLYIYSTWENDDSNFLYLIQPVEYDAYLTTQDTLLDLSYCLKSDSKLFNDIQSHAVREKESIVYVENKLAEKYNLSVNELHEQLFHCIQKISTGNEINIQSPFIDNYFIQQNNFNLFKNQILKAQKIMEEFYNDHDR